MTREDVIKGLNACIADVPDKCWENGDYPACPYNSNVDGCQLRMMKDVAELLKEREARTAVNIVKVHEGTLGNCPTCGAELMSYYNETHCGRCGQAVKWE